MDIKKYELFVDVAETGNFTKSAERIGYSQSGVSHLLKSLENEMGFPLFIRTKKGVKLTDNGKTILPLVTSLLACNETIEQTINEINGYEVGQIKIGTFTSIAIHWLPAIIYEFEKNHPNIKIKINEGGTDDIQAAIESDSIDLGFLSQRNSGHYEFLPLYEDPLMAVLPLDYSDKNEDTIPITGFDEEPFIISTMGTDYDIHFALNESKINPIKKYSCTDDHAIIAMVANNLGISILPDLIAQDYKHMVDVKPLEPAYSRTLGVAYHSKSHLTPAAKKFVSFTKAWIQQKYGK